MKNFFQNLKKRNFQLEGLRMIHEGMKVQIEQAKWHLDEAILSPESKEYEFWRARHHLLEYWMKEVDKAINDKLHY